MNREQAINYLICRGLTQEQVGDVVRALTYKPRDCANCKHYVVKDTRTNWGSQETTKIYGCECWECEYEPTTKNNLAGDIMDFPKTFDEFANFYGFKDKDEVYTNGSELIPVFRVKQWLEHISTTKNNLGVDCISKKNALRVANNEYLRGFHNALCKALNETYSIHCDEGHFRVIQEETLVGLGMSMESALGPDAESFMNTLPLVTPQLSVPEVTALAEWTEKLTKASEDAYNKGYTDGVKSVNICPHCGEYIGEEE